MDWQRDALAAMLISTKHRNKLIKVMNVKDFDLETHRWLFSEYIPLLGRSKATKKNLKVALKTSGIQDEDFLRSTYSVGKRLIKMEEGEVDFAVNMVVKSKLLRTKGLGACGVGGRRRRGRRRKSI